MQLRLERQASIGALTCTSLPSISLTTGYELWAEKGNNTLALGTLTPQNDGTASLLVTIADWASGPMNNLWVTLETEGRPRSEPSQQAVLQSAPPLQAQR